MLAIVSRWWHYRQLHYCQSISSRTSDSWPFTKAWASPLGFFLTSDTMSLHKTRHYNKIITTIAQRAFLLHHLLHHKSWSRKWSITKNFLKQFLWIKRRKEPNITGQKKCSNLQCDPYRILEAVLWPTWGDMVRPVRECVCAYVGLALCLMPADGVVWNWESCWHSASYLYNHCMWAAFWSI